jgi:hypothetical protein
MAGIPRLPTIENRLCLMGSTGSGKTTAAMFHLSRMPFHEMPITIIDSKRDKEIAALDAKWLGLAQAPPELPGLYVLPVRPGSTEDAKDLERYLTQVHERGRHGLFIDEGYSVYKVRQRGALTDIFTQGRSLEIPVIFNTQRPSGIGVEALSEASFFQVFDLYRPDDRKTAQEYIPLEHMDFRTQKIGQYRSLWRDPPLDATIALKPVRPAEVSVGVINARLAAMREEREGVRQLAASPEDKSKPKLRAV